MYTLTFCADVFVQIKKIMQVLSELGMRAHERVSKESVYLSSMHLMHKIRVVSSFKSMGDKYIECLVFGLVSTFIILYYIMWSSVQCRDYFFSHILGSYLHQFARIKSLLLYSGLKIYICYCWAVCVCVFVQMCSCARSLKNFKKRRRRIFLIPSTFFSSDAAPRCDHFSDK